MIASLPDWQDQREDSSDTLLPLEAANGRVSSRDSLADAEAALVSLGYKLTEASKMLADINPHQSTEALIKAALTQRMSG